MKTQIEWKDIKIASRKKGEMLLLWPVIRDGKKTSVQGYWHQPGNPEKEGYWITKTGVYNASSKEAKAITHWTEMPKGPESNLETFWVVL